MARKSQPEPAPALGVSHVARILNRSESRTREVADELGVGIRDASNRRLFTDNDVTAMRTHLGRGGKRS